MVEQAVPDVDGLQSLPWDVVSDRFRTTSS